MVATPSTNARAAASTRDTPSLLLSWPEDDLDDIVEAFENDLKVVYGAGTYINGTFVIKSRYLNKGKTEVDDHAIMVPAFYGFHLEHLCYQLRCYQISWPWAIENFFKDDNKVLPFYRSSAEAIGKTWLYHRNAFKAVMREICDLGDKIHAPQARIKSLDEWVIRQRFELAFAEDDELEEARQKGRFAMDIFHNASDLEPDTNSTTYNKHDYPPQDEEARRYWFDHDGFMDFEVCQGLLVTVHDTLDEMEEAGQVRQRPNTKRGRWQGRPGRQSKSSTVEKSREVEETRKEKGKGKEKGQGKEKGKGKAKEREAQTAEDRKTEEVGKKEKGKERLKEQRKEEKEIKKEPTIKEEGKKKKKTKKVEEEGEDKKKKVEEGGKGKEKTIKQEGKEKKVEEEVKGKEKTVEKEGKEKKRKAEEEGMKERKRMSEKGEKGSARLEVEASGEGCGTDGEGTSIDMPASKKAKIHDTVPSKDLENDVLDWWYGEDPRI